MLPRHPLAAHLMQLGAHIHANLIAYIACCLALFATAVALAGRDGIEPQGTAVGEVGGADPARVAVGAPKPVEEPGLGSSITQRRSSAGSAGGEEIRSVGSPQRHPPQAGRWGRAVSPQRHPPQARRWGRSARGIRR